MEIFTLKKAIYNQWNWIGGFESENGILSNVKNKYNRIICSFE